MHINNPILTNEKETYQEQHQLFLYIPRFYQLVINKLSVSLIKQPKLDQLKEMRVITNSSDNNLRFEISAEKMNELLSQRKICATDIRCLDSDSKQCLKKLCLKTCLYNLSLQQRDNSNMLTEQYRQKKTKFLRNQYE
ncbi:MAG: hypothetical protein V3U87_17385 [Methylococcaceae bacterium]